MAAAVPQTLEDLCRRLVAAIHQGDEAAALKLVPTQAEFAALGARRFAKPAGYAKFLAKRRRGFARVVAKFRRKNPAGCKTLTFARLIKRGTRQLGSVQAISSVDLFALCDGREIWLADPDMLLQTSAGWRLLEFS